MPELPDIAVYCERLAAKISGQPLTGIRVRNPFLVRSVSPPIDSCHGRTVREIGRLGKRIVLTLDGGLHLVLHLMIAGRLRWKPAGAPVPGKVGLAAFDFPDGTLVLTEAGSKRRAWLRVVDGAHRLAALDPGGIDVMTCTPATFAATLTSESHTLKRALTDPHLFSGIGNSYSDEILHRARLSPFVLTGSLDEPAVRRLLEASRAVLSEWTDRLRAEVGDGFPDKVTAFRAGMAVHGRYRKPCPVCASEVQRIVYADRECNYCATCQTGGRLLADRALSRLLRKDWPRTLDELEERRRSD